MSDEVISLPIDQIQPNPLQPRGVITPESLIDLVESIKTHGIIQPLVIAHTPAGYQLIAGERRWRAARLAGLNEVPVVIIETTPQGMLEMAIVENVQRTDLNPIDRAKSFDRLMVEFSLSNIEIAKRIGKSPAYISNTLRLLDLPDALKDGLISGVTSEGHARALSAIPDVQQMIEAYKIILKEGGSVRRAEELARRFKKNLSLPKNQKLSEENLITELSDRIAADLQESLGKNTKVKIRRSRVETALHIVLRGKPEDTEDQIQRIYRSLASPQTPAPSPSLPEISPNEVETAPTTPTDSSSTNPFEPIKDTDNEFEDY
jgi:ParB family transcriptional regulator, chromosome partitioning protein